MKIVKIKTYTFDELSEEAQARVIKEWQDESRVTEGWDWWHPVYEDWIERLGELGYTDIDINFSGFWSQGDGASFTAKIDLGMWLKGHKNESKYKTLLDDDYINAEVVRLDNRHSHENTVEAILHFDDIAPFEALASELEKMITKEVRELSKQIYKDLETHYEYLNSEEVIKDEANAGGREYLADGREYIA